MFSLVFWSGQNLANRSWFSLRGHVDIQDRPFKRCVSLNMFMRSSLVFDQLFVHFETRDIFTFCYHCNVSQWRIWLSDSAHVQFRRKSLGGLRVRLSLKISLPKKEINRTNRFAAFSWLRLQLQSCYNSLLNEKMAAKKEKYKENDHCREGCLWFWFDYSSDTFDSNEMNVSGWVWIR